MWGGPKARSVLGFGQRVCIGGLRARETVESVGQEQPGAQVHKKKWSCMDLPLVASVLSRKRRGGIGSLRGRKVMRSFRVENDLVRGVTVLEYVCNYVQK